MHPIKYLNYKNNHEYTWKTHPRMAYVPPFILVMLMALIFFTAAPVLAFETVEVRQSLHGDIAATALDQSRDAHSGACDALLQKVSYSSQDSDLSSRQRAAGSAAAFGLIIVVCVLPFRRQKLSNPVQNHALIFGIHKAMFPVTDLLFRLRHIVIAKRKRLCKLWEDFVGLVKPTLIALTIRPFHGAPLRLQGIVERLFFKID